jgi:alpha-1,2-mannosyltransferase
MRWTAYTRGSRAPANGAGAAHGAAARALASDSPGEDDKRLVFAVAALPEHRTCTQPLFTCRVVITFDVRCRPMATLLLLALGAAVAFVVVAVTVLLAWVRTGARRQARALVAASNAASTAVGFLHPYCSAGGGGERVLWCAVQALAARIPDAVYIIYTGDTDPASDILARAERSFGLRLPADRIAFVRLRWRTLVEAHHYPVLTMLGQSAGSVLLAIEALVRCNPDVMIDTTGYAFANPVFAWLGGCRVGCYTHYPTISTDMLERVGRHEAAFNNRGFIARSPALSQLKALYYAAFASVYGFVGRQAAVVLVNSRWTYKHIQALWNIPRRTHIVYPPCNTSVLARLPLLPRQSGLIVSVGQFRPEKNHDLQLEAMALVVQRLRGESSAKLVMVGGARHADDRARVERLRTRISELHLEDSVSLAVDLPFADLQSLLGKAQVGLHTMRDEHFGIGVVEFMAAGAIPVAHNSAGPQMDIVVPFGKQPTGFLATTATEYADALLAALALSPDERRAMQEAGRAHVQRSFSDEVFARDFAEYMRALIEPTV